MLETYPKRERRVVTHLEAALDEIEDHEARYHVREAMQILQDRS
jgi:hypothetical protein